MRLFEVTVRCYDDLKSVRGFVVLFVQSSVMSVIFSALSASQYQNLQGLIGFLAIVSAAIWISVIFVTLLRFAIRLLYKYKTKRLQKGRS